MLHNFSNHRLITIFNHCVKAKNLFAESAASFSSKPTISISKTKALVDEEVCIKVNGLHKGQEITLQTFVKSGKLSFGSCGHYVANEEGRVNTLKGKSHGGTFDGFEPMGLFWSMRTPPGTKERRILNVDVTKPFNVRIALHDGFQDCDKLPWTEGFPSLASCYFQQCFMGPGVQCIPIREDGLQGYLYLPPGEGPFPAVIDIFGMTPHHPNHRSSLLASKGIASFIIAYVGHEGLAHSFIDIDYSYFLKAYDWLAKHPKVNPSALGGVGNCVGAGYVSLIAWKRPSMKCFVGINSTVKPAGPIQQVEGETVANEPFPLDHVIHTDTEGVVSFKALSAIDKTSLPYWRHGIKVLHIQGTDDQSQDPETLREAHADLPEEFKKNVEFISYPGAGHIIEPPYMPLCRTSYNGIFNYTLLWGGQPKLHAHAQMDSWPRIVSFIKKHLNVASSANNTVSSQHTG